MAYIDREKLIRDLIDNKGFYPALVKSAIENAPTCDVVPRSEVEKLQKRISNQREEIERLRKHTHNLQQSRNHYKAKAEGVGKQLHNVLQNYHEKITEAEQEVAKEIFDYLKGGLKDRIETFKGSTVEFEQGACRAFERVLDKIEYIEKEYMGE